MAHPINSETRERINRFILDAYHRELERAGEGRPSRPEDDGDEGFDGMEDQPPPTGPWAG